MTDYTHVVAQLAAAHPEAWRTAHTGGPGTEDFIRLLAAHLHAIDPAVGLNGKRGNPNDISDDALAVFDEAGDVTDRTGRKMLVIDCIIGAGGPSPSPGWSSVGGPSPGAWVQPDAATPTPGPTPIPGAAWEPKHADLLARFPGPSSPSADFVRRVAEQFTFSFPGEGWGHKAASPTRPPSDNVIARQMPAGLVGFTIIPRTAAPAPIALAGQHFIRVMPQNHLGVPAPSPTPGPTPTPAPTPQPTPAKPSYPGDGIGETIGAMVFAQYAEAKEPPNQGMAIHIFRTCFDILDGMTPAAAIAKRQTELRAALKLPAA